MTKDKLKELVRSTKGRFFSLTFEKADGTRRVANGKNFYGKLIAGGNSTHSDSKSVPFVDRNKGSFISANSERVIAFKCGSLSYPETCPTCGRRY